MANGNNLPVIRKTITGTGMQAMIQQRIGEKAGTFTTSLLDVIGDTYQLQQCDPNLVVKEALKAAALDLPLNKNLGFAYIIPYKERGKMQPHFQMGYKGFVQLAIRTGQYKHLNPGIIYEGEEIIEDRIKGTLQIGGKKTSDTAIGYFCYMELINGFEKAIVWTREKVKAHAMKYSKSYAAYLNGKTKTKPVWEDDFDGMALKTMILQLVPKFGPMTIEMTNAMTSESRVDFKGFDGQVDAEITENANQEVIDIPGDAGPSNDVEKTETGPQEDQPMSDAEKAEIEAEERAAAQADGPGY